MTVATNGLRPFFGLYGGKWRDALKHYPAPSHDVIVEPFAGSAGYALRHFDRKVILCERDEIIAGLWKYLIQVKAAEIRRIPDLNPGQTVDDLSIGQEAKWLVGFWLNRATTGPRKSPSAWMKQGIRPGSFWGPRVRETIASQVDKIRHWKVHLCSYDACPYKGVATWFIDPPYADMGKHYRYGSEYLDYASLAEWCRTRPGQVIVCENQGAQWLPFDPLKDNRNGLTVSDVKTARVGRRSREVIWTRDISDNGKVSP
jgi:hypothetical protein